jgi:DNA-binding response OmpR family regulator
VKHRVPEKPRQRRRSSPPRSARGARTLLVVERDPLTQWSLKTYLQKWFDVRVAPSIAQAARLVNRRRFDALVIFADPAPAAADDLERRARQRNPKLSVVRTVTAPGSGRNSSASSGWLEKPFQLARLARLLGVPDEQLPHNP